MDEIILKGHANAQEKNIYPRHRTERKILSRDRATDSGKVLSDFFTFGGNVGDEIGSRIIAARLVRDVMRLCLLMERQYAPYSKWLGTAFRRLECSKCLTPILAKVLNARVWRKREVHLCNAYVIVAEMHNALHITGPIEPKISNFFERPYRVIFAMRFVQAIRNAITEESIREIHDLIGGIDQFADCTDVTDNVRLAKKLRTLYEKE